LTILLARLKQAAKWLWASAALLAAGMAWVLIGWWLSRRRTNALAPDPIDRAINRYDRVTAVAKARAAVEIAVARETNRQERARLLDVLRTQDYADEDEQIDRLIAEGKRLRGE
jgi:hypothetical protein